MPRGSGYSIRLTLSKEMRVALTDHASLEESPRDFVQGLKEMRAGQILYGVLTDEGLQAMYLRKLIDDDEVQFLLECGLVKDDFRPIPKERLLQAEEIRELNDFFGQVLENWQGLRESVKLLHVQNAKRHPDLANARKLLELVKEVRL